MPLRNIFFSFLKIGALAFGGGAAGLPIVKNEFTNKYPILSEDAFLELLVFSQSIPGLMFINLSAFIGYRLHGLKGMIIAVLGMIIPPITVITVIAGFFDAFMEFTIVGYLFQGLNIAIVVLILSFVWDVLKKKIRDPFTVTLFSVVLFCYLVFGFSPVIFILASALIGFAYSGRRKNHE